MKKRRFLQTLSLGTSAPILGPILNQISYGAEGEEAPLRFLFVVEGNSLPPLQVHPEGIPFVEQGKRNKFVSHKLAGTQLPRSLMPVNEYKNQITILQGLSGRMCSGGHSSDHGALGAYHANQGRNIQGPTIDGILGAANSGIFSNVVLGISSQVEKAIDFNCSASAKGRSLATILHPETAYNRLFGSVAKGTARSEFTARRELLHFMQEDIKRVKTQMGSVEKDKLDAYLSAFETLDRKSERLVEVREDLQKVAPKKTDKYQSKVETDRLDAHFEMATASLVGGLTNCATIASGVGFPNFSITFGGLGIEKNKHSIGHALYNEDDPSGWENSEVIREYHFQLITRSMKTLEAIPEGDGTLLDRTVIVYLSDGAETHHSRCYEWPMVVIGRAGGKLRAGRYLQYPDYQKRGHRTINTAYNTLLHAADVPERDDFGFLDPHLEEDDHRGPLSQWLG